MAVMSGTPQKTKPRVPWRSLAALTAGILFFVLLALFLTWLGTLI
jgi:hypothetical protein